jgi:glycosyltransferase involved in cell wall biosynthesis
MTETILHVQHSWGGGIQRWTSDFATADLAATHFVLESLSVRAAVGTGFLLRQLPEGTQVARWELQEPIVSAGWPSPEYAAILAEAVSRTKATRIVVSSLIGHGLDVLRRQEPITVVLHDYYPFCRAVHLSFFKGHACRICDEDMLQRCGAENPSSHRFRRETGAEWMSYRNKYLEEIANSDITFVAPSESVRRNLRQVWPTFPVDRVQVIPHGIRFAPAVLSADPTEILSGSKPRLIVLGSLTEMKGLSLLKACASGLGRQADILLLGSGKRGRRFRWRSAFTVVKEYENSELPERLAAFRPHAALFLSMVPETFSYTFSEASVFAIPSVAVRIGAFEDRIAHGVNGFLVGPDPSEILELLSKLFAKPEKLGAVRSALRDAPPPSIAAMVGAYRTLWTA